MAMLFAHGEGLVTVILTLLIAEPGALIFFGSSVGVFFACKGGEKQMGWLFLGLGILCLLLIPLSAIIAQRFSLP
jgi:hypothetical protein